MDFQFSEEQTLLTDSVRRYVDKEYDFESRKKILAGEQGYSDGVWQQFAEMGLLAIAVPAEHGGFGGGAVDLIGVMQAFGEALVVEPFLATVLGTRAIARAGSAAQQAEILPAVAEGRAKLAFAHIEAEARYDTRRVATTAQRQGEGYTLTGTKSVVLGAPGADRIVVSARTAGAAGDADGVTLFVVERDAPGVSLNRYRTFDALPAGDLRLDGVRVAASAALGEPGKARATIDDVLDFANALLCAEAVGAMEYANRATLEYIKTRKQFGVPIGTFQVLQHRMVDMNIAAEQSRSMLYLASTAVDSDIDAAERARRVCAARVRVNDACRYVSQDSVQLHGGMGMTEELKISHTFRRLTMLARRFGDADYYLERFARLDA